MVKNNSFSNNSKYLLISNNKHNRVFGLSKTENNAIDPKVLTLAKDKSFMSRDSIYKIKNLVTNKNPTKYSSPSSKEWVNSVYTYNKNYTKNLPTARNKINKMLTGYLNLTRLINKKRSNSRIILERKNSLNKTLVSKAETKITNDKVDLTVYIYNRNKKTIMRRLLETLVTRDKSQYHTKGSSSISFKRIASSDRRLRKLLKNILKRSSKGLLRKSSERSLTSIRLKKYKLKRYRRSNSFIFRENINKSLKSIRNKKTQNLTRSFRRLRKFKMANKILNARLIKRAHRRIILRLGTDFIKELRNVKSEIINALDNQTKLESVNNKSITTDINVSDLVTESFSKFELKYFSKYLSARMSKKMLLLHYMREIIANNNKFKNWFMLGLKETISNLYNKKVELNIVNQKYFYLNSDIFTKALVTRVRDRNNRILLEMKKALAKVPLATFRDSYYIRFPKHKTYSNIQKINKVLRRNIFSSIKYKHIQGVRIEAAGRLSKRLTAARSLSKLRYKGSLKNIYKTHLNNNFTILRGYVKPNVQYTNINSKTRNGAFGIKGWVSSN